MAAGSWKDWAQGELVTESGFQDIQDSIAFIYASESAANTALTNKVTGTQFYDTGVGKLKIWDGSAWQIVANEIPKTSYTPTFRNLTVGNGSLSAEYARSGDLVFANMELTFGSTTSITGSFITMSVPVTPDFSGFRGLPSAIEYEDSGTAVYTGWAKPYNVGGTSEVVLQAIQNTGNHNKIVEVTSTYPFTWTTNDRIIVQIVYMAG